MLWVRIPIMARCTTLCDKVCQWLTTGRWFSLGTPFSSTNKTDRHDITKIMLKVALKTIKPTNHQSLIIIRIHPTSPSIIRNLDQYVFPTSLLFNVIFYLNIFSKSINNSLPLYSIILLFHTSMFKKTQKVLFLPQYLLKPIRDFLPFLIVQ